MLGPLALRPCALLRAWGFQHIPFIACRILGTLHVAIKIKSSLWTATLCLALRCHWGKCYYQTQIYEESFFVGNPFEGPGWTGGTCPGTISLAHVLRGSCARGSFGQTRFSHKTLYSGFPGQKKQKASILRPIDTPEGTILHSTCHITSEQAGHFLRQMLQPISKVTNVQGKKEGYDTNNQLDTYMIFVLYI